MIASSASFEIERLNAINAALFSHLTFRAHQHVLYELTADAPLAAFGAQVEGRAAGLVICESGSKLSSIVSICVSSEFRNRGIGSELLRVAAKHLNARGCQQLSLTYLSGRPTTAALERILAKCDWPPSEPKHLVCTSDKRMYTAPWMSEYKLPASFEVFRWVDITPEDRAALERSQAVDGWVPEGLWPFDYDHNMEKANSLGVRYKGEVVGWVITQPREPDAVCYCCSYMRPDLQRRGRLIAAYAEAVHRQIQFTTKPIGIWIVPLKHESMAAFVLRRMKPYLISLAEFRQSKKRLQATVSEVAAAQGATA
jgi:GNAT superfamily N-acetyltransferase